MAQPYIGSQGSIEYREASGNGTLISPYIPQFSLSGLAYFSSANITRTSSISYSANDVYGGVFQLQNIGPSGDFIYLNSISVVFNASSLTGISACEVYLYNASPQSGFADNAAFNVPLIDRGSLLTLSGIGLNPILTRGGGTVVAETILVNRLLKLATNSTSLWGYLVTLGTGLIADSATISVYSHIR